MNMDETLLISIIFSFLTFETMFIMIQAFKKDSQVIVAPDTLLYNTITWCTLVDDH